METYLKAALEKSGLDKAKATVSRLPFRCGDGYSYGGEAVLTIGDHSMILGASNEDVALACELAERWNKA